MGKETTVVSKVLGMRLKAFYRDQEGAEYEDPLSRSYLCDCGRIFL